MQIRIEPLINEIEQYKKDGNILHFILDDTCRPMWSKQLERSYLEFNETLDMVKNYEKQRINARQNKSLQSYFDFITEHSGVIVDLASGPSGYFAPALDMLKSDSLFVATDACPTVLFSHARANKSDGFFILDLDLDKPLPFKNASIDVFCGKLICNVNNYRGLILEVYRCLKPRGRFAVIETFFEKDSATYHYLSDRDAVYSSIETYIDFCNRIGFVHLGGDIIDKTMGKTNPGDLLPIGEGDRSVLRTVFFKK